MRTASCRTGLALVLLLLASGHSARPQTAAPKALADDSIEDLMNIEVTSVSRKEEKLSKTAAAVYVINQEDIRRSGAANIPDLLRMVPGVDVAQIDANTWAISIRGFNDRYANKVLVLVDGRTVYTPTNSGVYWDQLDVPLEDIERIEITRGPGATVWGANAVNGVINIITKTAKDTQGAVVRVGGGSQGAAQGLVQYGGKAGDSGTFRVFGDYSNQGNLTASGGRSPAADGWNMWHGGFRSDWKLSSSDTVTVQGDFVRTSEGQTVSEVFAGQLPLQKTINDPVAGDSGNALARWNHKLASGSDTSLQVYFDRYTRHDQGVGEALNTLDIDFQHHLVWGARHDVVWGAGYRITADDYSPGYATTFVPLARTDNLFSTFVQDEITVSRSLWFTLGAKFEHNAYTGLEYEPSLKLLWQPAPKQSIWVSASRAIVQTSRNEANILVDLYTFPVTGGGFGVAQVQGNPEAKAERLFDVEAGYRVQVNKRFSLDGATFSSFYNNLAGLVPQAPVINLDQGPPHLVIPYIFEYVADGYTYGAEISGTWSVTRRWRISPSLSAIQLVMTNNAGTTRVLEDEDNTPQLQAQIRSSLDLAKNIDWDVSINHVGRLRGGGDGAVPAFNRLDTRLAWRLGEFTELSVVGQNLLTPLHAEFHNTYQLQRTLVERSVFGRITWRF